MNQCRLVQYWSKDLEDIDNADMCWFLIDAFLSAFHLLPQLCLIGQIKSFH